MSIAGDLLTAATPARLLCRRGAWVLELVRLVPVDKNVFQPRTQRLEGSDAVLQHLKRNGDNPALASSASQLMRALRPDEERSFEAVDGDWIPSEPGARRDTAAPSAPPPGGSSVAGEVAELRAELLILRAAHERLRERIVRLESQALVAGSAQRAVLSLPPRPVATVANVSEAPRGPAPFAATLAQGQAPAAAPPPFLEATPARVAQGPRVSERGVKFPSASALGACLRSTSSERVSARERRPVSFSLEDPGPCWLARLIDDAGEEVGAIVSDLAATTALGGALMMLTPAEVKSMVAEQAPSEDVLSAMSEVANIVSGTISQQPGAIRVRVKPLEQLAPGALSWAKTPGLEMELELAEGQGRLLLLAR